MQVKPSVRWAKGGGNFDRVEATAFAVDGDGVPLRLRQRGNHVFLTEFAASIGHLEELGRVIEVVTHAHGWGVAVTAPYTIHMHMNGVFKDDHMEYPLLTLVQFGVQRFSTRMQTLRKRFAVDRGAVAALAAEEAPLRSIVPAVDRDATGATARALLAFDAMSEAKGAQDITWDGTTGSFSFQGGYRLRDQAGDAKVASASGVAPDFNPPHVRKRDLRGDAHHAALLREAAVVLEQAGRAVRCSSPHVPLLLDHLLSVDATQGAFVYPPRSLSNDMGLPFPELVARFKGGPDWLRNISGGHCDNQDIALGTNIYTRPVATDEPLPPSPALPLRPCAGAGQQVAALRMQLRLDGGACMIASDRALRLAENKRRQAAGLPKLPRGIWPADFSQAGGEVKTQKVTAEKT